LHHHRAALDRDIGARRVRCRRRGRRRLSPGGVGCGAWLHGGARRREISRRSRYSRRGGGIVAFFLPRTLPKMHYAKAKAMGAWQQSPPGAQTIGFKAVQDKAIAFAKENAERSFGLASDLARAN